MIPAVSDIPFTPEASFYIAHKLMKRGAKIYLFKDGFHHSKVMMVDSTFCTVALQTSTAAACATIMRPMLSSSTFNNEPVEQHVREGQKEQYLLTPEMWKKRSGWKKVSRLG